MPHMSLQSLNLFGHGVEVFSIILLPRGLHSPKSGTACYVALVRALAVKVLIKVNSVDRVMLITGGKILNLIRRRFVPQMFIFNSHFNGLHI